MHKAVVSCLHTWKWVELQTGTTLPRKAPKQTYLLKAKQKIWILPDLGKYKFRAVITYQ